MSRIRPVYRCVLMMAPFGEGEYVGGYGRGYVIALLAA